MSAFSKKKEAPALLEKERGACLSRKRKRRLPAGAGFETLRQPTNRKNSHITPHARSPISKISGFSASTNPRVKNKS